MRGVLVCGVLLAHATGARADEFATKRACTEVKAVERKPVAMAKIPAKVRKATKVAPATLAFAYDGKKLLYQTDKWYAVSLRGGKPTASTGPNASSSGIDPGVNAALGGIKGSTRKMLELSTKYWAVTVNDTLTIVDGNVKRAFNVLPTGVTLRGEIARVDDTGVAIATSENQLFLVDAAARERSCVSVAGSTTFAATRELFAYRRGNVIAVADVAAGTETPMVDVTGVKTVVLTPAKSSFVVQLDDALYALTGKTITRITAPLKGWTTVRVAPDGSSVAYVRGLSAPQVVPPKPPTIELARDPGDPYCDPRGCSPGSCDWQSNGCGGHNWCGHCQPAKLPTPPKDAGIYVITL